MLGMLEKQGPDGSVCNPASVTRAAGLSQIGTFFGPNPKLSLHLLTSNMRCENGTAPPVYREPRPTLVDVPMWVHYKMRLTGISFFFLT